MTSSFNPPVRRLMGPGPSDVHPRVLAAMGRPTIGHLDPSFIAMMDEIKDLLRYAFQTKNELTIPVSGPGSVGMEACFVNLVEPGDKVEKGEGILVIEAMKMENEIGSPKEGTVGKVEVAEGDRVEAGARLAVIE